MGESDSDIIIKGGSVELTYDPTIYTKDLALGPMTWKSLNMKITQVVITNDDNNQTVYDSGEHVEGLKFTISTRCR